MKQLTIVLNKIGKEAKNAIIKEIDRQKLIKTGNLRKSIQYKLVGSGLNTEIEFEMIYYGEYLDDGTKYIQPPREFFDKFIKKTVKKYEAEIAQAIIIDSILFFK